MSQIPSLNNISEIKLGHFSIKASFGENTALEIGFSFNKATD